MKNLKRIIISLGLVLVVAFAATACGKKEDTLKDTAEKLQEAGEKLQETGEELEKKQKEGGKTNEIKLGETYNDEDDKVSIKVSDINMNYQSTNQFYKPKDGDRYVMITLDVENKSDKDYITHKLYCNADGQQCESSIVDDAGFGIETVKAGLRASYKMCFEVPTSANAVEAEMELSVISKNKLIIKCQ